MLKERNRQGWVDIAKGIAITAVVLGHINFLWPNHKLLPLNTLLVWLWHVPVFFLIGGFFIKDEKLQQPILFIKGKFKSLYLLILYIYVPVLLLHNFFLYIGVYDTQVEYVGKYVTYWGGQDLIKNLIAAVFFAGREPLLGAMWFVYVLFMALCGLSIISFALKKIVREDSRFEYFRCLAVFILCILSCTLTNILGITVPRLNNTITAIWLIYVGMVLVQKRHITFENGWIALFSFILAWHCGVIQGRGVGLAANEYQDVATLTITSGACLYVICFVSKKIENNIIGTFLRVAGKESFYIMGLHFLAFKALTYILILCGYDRLLADLCPTAGGNVGIFLLYTICGVALPVAFIKALRKVRALVK